MFWCVSHYLGAFGTVWLPYETRCKTGRTSAKKFVLRSRIGIFHKECTRSTPLDPKLTFHVFRTIWVHSGPFGCLTKLGAKWACKSSCHEVASEFYATNTADPPNWTLYRRFGAYHTWMHSGPFGCPTKLGAKRTELVQKFLPRSRVGIFRKRTHPPPHWTLN